MNEQLTIIVLCTVPDSKVAKSLAHGLLKKKLAACITTIPHVVSYYYWQNQLQQMPEVQMIIKSEESKKTTLFSYIKQHHPYNVPELLSLTVNAVEEQYLSWLKTSLS